MNDTRDFVNRLRNGDMVSIIKEAKNGDMVFIKGRVLKQWSTSFVAVLDDTKTHHIIRDSFNHISGDIMSIRYSKEQS